MATWIIFCKNTNELSAKGYKADNNNEPVPGNITNPETHQYHQSYKHLVWDGIDQNESIRIPSWEG